MFQAIQGTCPPAFQRHSGNKRKIWKRVLALAAISLSACAVHTESDNVMMIRADPGGAITERMNEIADLNARGVRVEIRGHCISTCTMFLGVDNVCVDKDHLLEFHSPYWGKGIPYVLPLQGEMNAQDHRIYSAQMAQYYPPNIRAAFLSDWSKRIHKHVKKTGAELKAMDPDHVELC